MNKIVQLMISALIFIPLIFWSFTPNPFATPKELGIAIVGIVSLLSLAYQAAKTKNLSSLSLSTSLPLILFMISIIATLFANPEGRPEALQSKGLTLILLPMLAYIIATYKSNHLVSFSQKLLVGIGTFFSIHSLLSLVFLSKSPYLPTIMQNISFTFTGSYPTTLTIILLSFVLLASYLKNLNKKQRTWSYLILSLHIIALTAIIALMFPGGALSPNNLSFSASWSIALDALKSMRSLFFGIGLSNYSLLYTSVKPLFVNTTTLWNTLPATSVNEILTLLPTAGVLATISLFYLILHLLIKTFKTPLFLPSLVIILSLFAFPASSSIYLLFFLFYGLSDHRESTVKHVSSLQAYLTGIVCVVVAVAIAFISSRTILSERYITLAQQKLASTNTQEAYQYHIKAIQTSPKITNYHLSFADVNFKLAAA